jgi:hypothetical protein
MSPARALVGLAEAPDRFLVEITRRVPLERQLVLHLFAPIRHGAIESGTAVLAAEPPPPLQGELALPGPPPDPAAQADAPPGAPPRPVVFTARYRVWVKGRERGKWEFAMAEQAEAPLATVDAVVRGVLTRRDEATDPERLGPDAVRVRLEASGLWQPQPA